MSTLIELDASLQQMDAELFLAAGGGTRRRRGIGMHFLPAELGMGEGKNRQGEHATKPVGSSCGVCDA